MNSRLNPSIRRVFSIPPMLALALSLVAGQAFAQAAADVEIVQSRGADQALRYRELVKYGPWDDRNYRLRASDLKVLAPNESELHPQIPAFFRVELRKEWPHLKRTGAAQYPRAALQLFRIRYGGLKQNGVIKNDRREQARAARDRVPLNGEIQLNQLLGANEVTVEINPSNPQQVIAGANNAGGQEMYYSTDGGTTWNIQGVLPNTCCDPTVDWSSNGSVAYAAALSGAIGVSAWRSTDGGQSWVNRVNLTNSGSDKEFIHVDKSLTSPYTDNVYLTYHNGNTMQFARSEDMGFTYGIQAFNSAPSGIGSDITTDSAGNIYYFYGAFNTQQIIMLKSTDGGDSFGPTTAVATTNGAFDFPIPSMESRRAWIYTAADADRSGGAYDGSIYVAWTDTVGPENDGSASANHTRVRVAYSRDGGATWSISTPHSTTDMLTVDRWNQWLSVDEFGTVHVVYYDTRNSANRTGVDLYYTYSTDGGLTWVDAERISSQTSANLTDGQEFGDYNGISVVGTKGIPVWTDNREGPPNDKDVFAREFTNETASPGFALIGDPTSLGVCAPGNLDDIDVSVTSILGFGNEVTLSCSGLPADSSCTFTDDDITVDPGDSTVAMVYFGSVATGIYSFNIDGVADEADNKTLVINVAAFDDEPSQVALVAPADGATDQPIGPTLTWTAVNGANNYVVELDDDPGFGSIDYSESTQETSVTPMSLDLETTYYWRVRAENPCGDGVNSAEFSFTTGVEICFTGFGAIPDAGSTSDTQSVGDSGELTDMDVLLRVTHTYVGDLAFTLVHEDTGTSVAIVDRPGVPATTFGCSSNDIDVVLDDEASDPVETACASSPAIGGSLTPNAPLSAFDGEDLSGTWRLDISDNAGADTGTLDEWCLLPARVPAVIDSDEDGITDDLDNCTEVPNADQRDTNGDGFGNICDPDLDNNGVINFLDLGLLKSVFFTADPDADFDGGGAVNFVDLGIMKSLFLGPPGPSGLAP